MNQSVLTLTPGGLPLSMSLGFEAQTVMVDNFTSSYVQLTDVGKLIPPWTYGEVVALPPGLRQANAKLIPSTAPMAGPPVPLSQATLTWTDQQLPSAPAQLLQAGQYGAPSSVMVTTANAGGTQTATPTVPSNTIAVGYEIVGTISNLKTITIVGVVTGRTYVSDSIFTDNPPAPVLIDPADTTLTCTVTPVLGQTPPAVDFISWAVPVPVRAPPAAATWQPRFPFDWNTSFFLDGAGTLSGTVAIPAGKKAILAAYSFVFINNVATGYLGTLSFADDNGTFWRDGAVVPATAFTIDRAEQNDLQALGTKVGPGTLTASLNNAQVGNQFSRLSAGGYFQ